MQILKLNVYSFNIKSYTTGKGKKEEKKAKTDGNVRLCLNF